MFDADTLLSKFAQILCGFGELSNIPSVGQVAAKRVASTFMNSGTSFPSGDYQEALLFSNRNRSLRAHRKVHEVFLPRAPASSECSSSILQSLSL